MVYILAADYRLIGCPKNGVQLTRALRLSRRRDALPGRAVAVCGEDWLVNFKGVWEPTTSLRRPLSPRQASR